MSRINVTKSSLPSLEEYTKEIESIWNTHWLTKMGEKHEEFERVLKDYLFADHLELLVNGHMAIEMTLQAFDFPKGSEVITTPFTFASTTHAIVRLGLKPVFCDIDDEDYTIHPENIAKLITKNTVAILPVHVYGNICDVDGIDRLAKEHGLKVIYDAAHAFAEKMNGQSIVKFGDATCLSFHATKVFTSIEGGAVCYRSEALGQKIYDLKNFGIHGENNVAGIGANAKMNEFCAAMGICNLRHIDEEIRERERVYKLYHELLDGVEGLKLHRIQDNVISNYSYFSILIIKEEFGVDRDVVYDALVKEEIYPRKYFYPLTSEFECYKGLFDIPKTPVAKKISEEVLTFPIYGDLSDEDVERVAKVIISLRT